MLLNTHAGLSVPLVPERSPWHYDAAWWVASVASELTQCRRITWP